MATYARDVMTADPARCSADTPLDQVAQLMVEHDCGEIPIVDSADRPIGVITDRDIVCRVVAERRNPIGYSAETYMTTPAVTVHADAPLRDVVATMEKYRIRRVPVVDDDGCCAGIISQADVARTGREHDVAELVRLVSNDGRAQSLILL